MSKGVLRHFSTGVWVLIFGLVAIPLYLIWAGVITVGGLRDNPALLILLSLAWLFVALVIGGWAARMGVSKVR